MKITGVIPARYQSSRFPGKPLALIAGKPMIWWVYNQAAKVNAFDELLVATDSNEIYDKCKELNIPARLTKDTHPTGTDRLGEIAEMTDSDFYVNIQGDEPLIEPEVIQKIIDYRLAHPEVEVINTMAPLKPDQDVNELSIVKAAAAKNDDLLYLSRSPIPCSKKGMKVDYKRHLGLYGLSREALLFYSHTDRGYLESIEDVEMLRFMENGYRIKILEVNSESIGVDNPEDIAKVEAILAGDR
ncbi:MAG: 3-deoxy-manno-octulosonate cytidylyltransferase [Eubacterium sp.]|nr:3-deoxy-manno-octulosonate cytidylyltransferase [Eubacterium sp.]